MSINTILSTATSGLLAAQVGVRTVSDNVANATTPGYVRKVVNQTSLVTMGQGSGVHVEGVARVVDRYLQSASLIAGASAGRADVLSEMLDRAQGLFGDPSGASSFFSKLNDVTSAFAALADDPASSLTRGQALSTLRSFFDDSARISASLVQLQQENDTRIRANVSRANDLLGQIASLNAEIRRARIGGADASGSENIQSQLINELSGLINIQTIASSDGGAVIRTQDGMLLADELAGVIDYQASTSASGFLTVRPANGGGQVFDGAFSGGEIVGLLEARNTEIPAAMAQLAEFTAGAAREINRAHNASSSVPPPTSLTGRNTGLDLTTAIGGFTGQTAIVFTNAQGVVQSQVDIDFSGGGISINSVPSSAATFLADLNTAMGANGSATFVGGVLRISANTGGLAIQDLAGDPALKAGQGFSQFFGLNDLIRSSTFPTNTGLTASDPHGFTAGQTLTLRLTDPSGGRIRDVTVTVPATNTMAAMTAAMDAGVAPYGQFALDANGRLSFQATTSPAASLSVASDSTSRGTGGPSLSAFFGLGTANLANAAAGYSVDPAIYQNPTKLAVARLDLSVAPGTPALAIGDGRGAFALAAIGEAATGFGAAGSLPASTMSLSRYASEFAGSLGRRAAAADNAKISAQSVKAEADTRRSSYEGVNMDEELIRLTTYQQAFNASARLIQAANDLYDTLLKMV